MSADGVFDFGLRLRRLRKDRGMSRASLAKRLDVSKEAVYRYEDNLQDPALNRNEEEQRTTLNEFIRVFVHN